MEEEKDLSVQVDASTRHHVTPLNIPVVQFFFFIQ